MSRWPRFLGGLLTLWLAVGTIASASAAPARGPAYVYDAASNTLETTIAATLEQAPPRIPAATPFTVPTGGFSAGSAVFVAAETGISATDQAALDYASNSTKLDPIFAAKQNFDPLVQQFGSREAVVQQFLTRLKGVTPANGTFEEQILVGGQKVIVRGAVVDGVTKIGTAFTP